MDFKTLDLILRDLIDVNDASANYPIMIRGRHGIGKSHLIYQLGERLGMKVVERRASQMQEGRLLNPVFSILLSSLDFLVMVKRSVWSKLALN